MNILCDTDVLSCFAKIKGLQLLKQLFPNAVFLISTAVYEELMRCKDAGFSFPDRIFEFTDVTQLNKGELEEYKLILARARHLGHGEIHSIIIARFRKYPFLTNDKIAKKFAKEYGVVTWDIPDILKALWAKGVKSKEEIKRIISEMERNDRMVIQDIWSK